MHAGARQVLLLFKKGASRAIQSPHDGDGELHVAFAIPISNCFPKLNQDELGTRGSFAGRTGIGREQ